MSMEAYERVHRTFKQHTISNRQKVNAVKSILYPLIGRKSKLSLSNKLLLYKSLVRPVMSYASPVWGAAAKSNIQTSESAQNIIARQITNSPWFICNRYIAKDIKLQPIKDYFKKRAINFFNKIEKIIVIQQYRKLRSQPPPEEAAPKDTSPS
ncbi:hypothetical protein AVEN_55923-1 [Araneus ventricosus]|uniref:RNA-directed DNA polymerase from transposon X-element n=1 Tax=Araneus ventricosus TaxID=182803 RepID=A0A4Y2I5W9_ARAVE|nr:hypothetical protein AVEN_55923-1 [Araneus ventricosus]